MNFRKKAQVNRTRTDYLDSELNFYAVGMAAVQ